VLAALSIPALITTQSPLRFEYPANPAPTFIIHTLMKKNNILITMNIVALIIVNPNVNPIGAGLIFYPLLIYGSWLFFIYFVF